MEPKRQIIRRRGFTLIELLLVLAILGILAGLVVSNIGNHSEKARRTAAKTEIATIRTAIQSFQIDMGRYPAPDEGLVVLTNRPSAGDWDGPYLDYAPPVDPWGNTYQYRFPGQKNAEGFDVYSLGVDGREGGDDIGNWR